ncbi:hypothetical protein PVAG01_05850 [Phlyctema vagabunda]|uniref:Uncharacterized protein n=1 Tax=Phlyctema vagabunda TaxID=108571 RepID=A0ABR4PEH2_9HELO
MSSESHVYKGVWIDWSHGPVLGATLTLSSNAGAILGATLAFWVTLAAGGFWTVSCFVLHQIRAARNHKEEFHDGLYCQQQAVLRNSGSPSTAAWELMRLSWGWRKSGRRSLRRSLRLFLIATLILLSFTAASIFTSQIQKSATTDVLIIGSQCGMWSFPTSSASGDWALKILSLATAASAYARDCYTGQENLQCATYTTPYIPWAANGNVSCPFETDLCYWPEDTSFEMDTGLLDSHSTLGLNAPSSQRLLWRKKATCSPMRLRDYVEGVNVTVGDGNTDFYARYFLGPTNDNNWTYQYNTHGIYQGAGYNLLPLDYLQGFANYWHAIDPLSLPEADTTLLFLAQNALTYNNPVDDPMFAAHIEDSLPSGLVFYRPDFFMSTMGCVDQYQYCNPAIVTKDGLPTCTPLTSKYYVTQNISMLGLSDWQLSTITRINENMFFSSMYYSAIGLGESSMLASQTVFDINQVSLPVNQWQIEAANWFNISLARLQQSLVEYAAGPTDLGETGSVLSSNDAMDKLLCHSQKVLNSGPFTNFSILGIAITFAVGGVLIFLGLTIDVLVSIVKSWIGKGEYSRLAWVLDEKFQLQRMAFEGKGWDEWVPESKADLIPVMKKGQSIGKYDIVEKEHPTIVHRKSMPAEMSLLSDNGEQHNENKGLNNQNNGAGMHYAERPISEV